jgi:putative tryptophan/tyrosine transport system substrate-binding protein
MHFGQLRRREFITLLGGMAAWPLAASAQDTRPARLIGVLMGTGRDEDLQASLAAFLQALKQLGWVEGRNVHFDIRWGEGRATETHRHAVELAALAPDIIFASGIAPLQFLLRETRTIPIVFCNLADPVGAGLINSLARPGGNATGFTQFEYTLSTKWLELLKQIAPGLVRVAVLRDAEITAGIGQFAVIQSVASALGVEVSAINMSDAGEIERGVNSFAQSPNGGLILTTSAKAVVHRDLIIALAARHKLPMITYRRYFVVRGALASYGYDIVPQFQLAAGYVDRILKGAKPADLPVQAPTKYELAINLKTAKTLGIEMPPMLLARADEVIE